MPDLPGDIFVPATVFAGGSGGGGGGGGGGMLDLSQSPKTPVKSGAASTDAACNDPTTLPEVIVQGTPPSGGSSGGGVGTIFRWIRVYWRRAWEGGNGRAREVKEIGPHPVDVGTIICSTEVEVKIPAAQRAIGTELVTGRLFRITWSSGERELWVVQNTMSGIHAAKADAFCGR